MKLQTTNQDEQNVMPLVDFMKAAELTELRFSKSKDPQKTTQWVSTPFGRVFLSPKTEVSDIDNLLVIEDGGGSLWIIDKAGHAVYAFDEVSINDNDSSNAFITTYNCEKIVKSSNLTPLNIKGDIYKSRIDFFSKREEQRLLAVKELIENPEQYFDTIYKPIKVIDSKKYVYKERQPSYHTTPLCEKLTSDYINFELPGEIVSKGDSEIERFRIWFGQNEHLLEKPDIFVMRLQSAFNITYNPKSIKAPNSGFGKIENWTMLELENKIDTLLREANTYFYANKKNEFILSHFVKRSGIAFTDTPITNNKTEYSETEIKDFLRDFHLRFKLPIRKFLIEYYRVKLNHDLKFAQNYLEALGFRKCTKCSNV